MLLQNTKANLPYRMGLSLAVVGPLFNATVGLFGSPNYFGPVCADGTYDCVTSVIEAFMKANVGGVVKGAMGCAVNSTDTSGFAAALDIAKAADSVVVMAGLDSTIENESHDRVLLTLPGVQSLLIQEIIALGKPTTLVLINGGQISLDPVVINGVGSILEAWYPGPHGGEAIASAVFGVYNPGGKLPVTVYPANFTSEMRMSDMNMTTGNHATLNLSKINRHLLIGVGRSYKYYSGVPQWPFGYGLSFTTFSVVPSEGSFPSQRSLNLKNSTLQYPVYSVVVTNTGTRAGDAVVLAFSQPPARENHHSDPQPQKQLFGYQRVSLQPGQNATLVFPTTAHAFAQVTSRGERVCFPGLHRVMFSDGGILYLRSLALKFSLLK